MGWIKMKKIFKMRKLLILVLLLFLGGCFKNEVVPNENEIHLYLDEEYTQHMPYEEIPSFTFSFNGIFNTLKYVPETYYTLFARNDDVILSDEISNLLKKYEDRTEYVIEEETVETATRINTLDASGKQITHQYLVDDKKVYDEIAYISLENGLKLTIDYRRFTSEGKTYYVWSYTNNLNMHLYYPLMVVEVNNQRYLLLLTLPNRVNFQVGPGLKVENMLKRDDYLDEVRYTFNYLDDYEILEAKISQIKNYYLDEYDGYTEGSDFFFTYLGIKYKIIFNEENFIISYVEGL